MRVALDLSPACGEWTGVGRYVRDLASGLAATGARPFGVYQGHRGALPGDLARLCDGVARYDLAGRRIGLALRLPRALARAGCDAWHETTTIGNPGRGWRGAIVATVHDCWPLDPRSALPARRARLFARLLDGIIARAAIVICPSHHTARDVRARGWNGELRVIHHGIAPPPPTPQRPIAEPYVLTVGAIEPRKRYDLLAQALAIGARPAWHHLGPVRDDPRGAIAQAMDAAGCVRHGWVDEATREAWLANALLVAQPSVTEGFGYVALEAMARGVPVVCAWAGAPVEILGDAAVWVHEPPRPEAWAEAIRPLTRDHGLRARLAGAGRARAARFTIAAMVGEHLRAYADAPAAAGRRAAG